MTQVVNHKGKRLKVGPREGGGLPYIYLYIYGLLQVWWQPELSASTKSLNPVTLTLGAGRALGAHLSKHQAAPGIRSNSSAGFKV